MSDRPASKTPARTLVVEAGAAAPRSDQLATEEPLEIRLRVGGGKTKNVAVTMRTPGADFELAAGFLFNEGVVGGRDDISGIAYCVDADVEMEQRYNIVTVALRPGSAPDLAPLERHFFSTSACGVCGKASLEALSLRGCQAFGPGPDLDPEVVYSLPEQLRHRQGIFQATGGLHAAALFDTAGNLVQVREDVGRHNAIDKLVGWAVLDGRVPLRDHLVLVSGRSSYEVVQKCLSAGAPIVCSVSAPSSLAVTVAETFNMTLIGFLRGKKFNIYSGAERLRLPSHSSITAHTG